MVSSEAKASGIEAKQMTNKRPTTIAEYIQAAPPDGQQHLNRMYAILKSVAPDAEEAIKWGTPFFVEPRFLFAFSAHKAHCSLAPVASAMEVFREDLAKHQTTKGLIKFPYHEALPEELIRRVAEYCLQETNAREDDGFW